MTRRFLFFYFFRVCFWHTFIAYTAYVYSIVSKKSCSILTLFFIDISDSERCESWIGTPIKYRNIYTKMVL